MMKKALPYCLALLCVVETNFTQAQIYINEDFSTAFGTTPPSGWSQLVVVGDPLIDSFHFDNPGARTFNPPITSPAAVFDSDDYSSGGGAEDVVLATPVFDASAASVVMLEFDQYFQGGFGGQVYVIATDGITIDTVFTTTTTTPNPDAQVIDISSSVAGSATAQVLFVWTGSFSWYWIIDNVNIFTPSPADVGIIAIDAPTSGCGLSASEDVTVQVKNFGSSTQTGFPVSFSIDGGMPVTETFGASIAAGATISYTFTGQADLSSVATYMFDAYTSLAGDANPANDSTLNVSVVNIPALTTFPYSEDFEAEPTCGTSCNTTCILASSWANEQVDDDVDWTTDQGGTGSSATGPSADHTNGTSTGKYLYLETSGCSGQTAILTSPCLDISGLSGPAISFWYHMAGATMGNLYIEIDSGSGYIIVDSLIGTQQSAPSDPWLFRLVSLVGYPGIISIRFRGVAGSSFTSDMALDDISIFSNTGIDVSMLSITAPNSGCALTASETISIEVLNNGTVSLDTIPVAYSIDGGVPVFDTIFPVILAGGHRFFFLFHTGRFIHCRHILY